MVIGVLGAGQLGMMLALAGIPLGIKFKFFSPAAGSPGSLVAPQLTGSYADLALLEQFAAEVDVVTYEFENVPVETALHLAKHVPVYPPPAALEVSQDRRNERALFERLGIPTPRFVTASSQDEVETAVQTLGVPLIAKTRRGGYDGKGQRRINQPNEAADLFGALGGQPLILEQLVEFDRELSLVAVRSGSSIAFYPLTENVHRDGLLRVSRAPAERLSPAVQKTAEQYVTAILEDLDYRGVLAVELFEKDGQLLANETAPRVHNSGHWTIEGAATSQFENHVRAVCGWPLGSTESLGFAAMLNLIGDVPSPDGEALRAALAEPGVHVHLYHKAAAPGRKVGHVTVVAREREAREQRLERLTKALRC